MSTPKPTEYPHPFKFDIAQNVQLAMSARDGIVTGRAQYRNAGNAYLVLHLDHYGEEVDEWIGESRLVDENKS